MIDTHAHLHGKDFTEDLGEVLGRARDAGIQRIVLIGVNIEDSHRALELAKEHPEVLSVVAGVHPHDANSWNPTTADILRGIAKDPQVVALGEMGLDYHYDFSPRDQQRLAFLQQLELARELDMPIVIHCREAYDDVLEVLEQSYGTDPYPTEAPPRGVLHCYFGTPEQAERGARLGFLLGIGGACTFKKAEELHAVVQQMPLDRFVLETDAPYMTPIPYRGKRNESAHIPLVAARIAELKNVDVTEVAEKTTAAAKRLYRLPG